MNHDLKKALKDFEINTCRTIGSTGVDAVREILPMIHGLSTLLAAGFRKEIDGKSVLEAMNSELVASTFDAISFLSAVAMFQAEDI